MRLGEVLRKDEAVPPPPNKRRGGWLIWLLAPATLAVAAWVHGPGVAELQRDEVLVVRGWPFGPPRVVAEPGLVAWVPLLQSAHRFRARTHRSEVKVEARLAEGARLTGGTLRVQWTPRPEDLPSIATRWGHDPDAWDAAVAGVAAVAVVEAVAAIPTTTLRDDAEGVRQRAAKAVGDELAALGVRVDDVQMPPLRLVGETGQALQTLAALERRATEAKARQAAAEQTTASRHEAVRQAWRVRKAALTTELAEATAAGRREAAEVRAQADRAQAQRLREATARRDAVKAQAKVFAEARALEARALAVRAQALATHGERLVERAIAERILPQMVEARAAEDAP